MDKELSKYMAEIGSKGGKAAAKNLTPEQRSQKMREVAQKRWKKNVSKEKLT